ncbi:MAG: SurA N-terminal domain-containing protein [Bermanella sp.]
MLQTIRDGSKGIVAKIIVGLIILTFALFGIESIVALGGGEKVPAEVNGEEISSRQVAQMIQLQKRRLQSQFGESFDPSLISDNMLRKAAVESLINESLLKQAAAEGGIYFSDEEIDKLIVQSPEFQVAGVFDRDQYDLVLRSAGYTRSTHRALLRANLVTQQAQSAWQLTAFSTQSEEGRSAQLDSQTRTFSFIEYKLEDVKKNVSISAEEKQTYYTENSSRFMTNESVVIDYIELEKSSLLADIEISEDELLGRYEDIKAESSAKREYRAAHILLLESNESSKKTLQAVQSKINSGETFEALAEQYSQDDSSKLAGGDLGFASADVYEPEFSDALNTLSKGQVSEVVQTRDGLHLIKLIDTRQPEVASYENLKDSLVVDIKSEKAQGLYVERLESLNDAAFSANGLQEPAKDLGLNILTTDTFSKAGGKGIASDNKVIQAAFSEAILFDDANSEVIELSDGRAVVLHLKSFNESVIKSLDLVETQVEAIIRDQKGTKELESLVEASLEQAKKDELVSVWDDAKNTTRNDEGVDAAILAFAFTMAEPVEGSVYGQVNLGAGNKAILRLDSIERVESATAGVAEEQKIERAKSFNEYKAYAQHFTDRASIERN